MAHAAIASSEQDRRKEADRKRVKDLIVRHQALAKASNFAGTVESARRTADGFIERSLLTNEEKRSVFSLLNQIEIEGWKNALQTTADQGFVAARLGDDERKKLVLKKMGEISEKLRKLEAPFAVIESIREQADLIKETSPEGTSAKAKNKEETWEEDMGAKAVGYERRGARRYREPVLDVQINDKPDQVHRTLDWSNASMQLDWPSSGLSVKSKIVVAVREAETEDAFDRDTAEVVRVTESSVALRMEKPFDNAMTRFNAKLGSQKRAPSE